jgi:hypothetical protein
MNAAVGFLAGLIVGALALGVPLHTELTAVGHWVMTWVGG